MMIKYNALLIVIVLTNALIFGQQPDSASINFEMDSVVVSVYRYEQPVYQIPFSIDVIDSEVLSLFNESLSSENLFRTIPGVIVNNRQNFSSGDRIIVRGIGSRSQFGIRGIKILLDGIPLTFADGQSQLNNLDLNSIGRIEIIRGPSSFLYGNSSGGVIYIQSNYDKNAKFNFKPSYNFGSFGFQKFSFTANGGFENNSFYISVNKIKNDGFREFSASSSSAVNIISSHEIDNNLSIKTILNYYDAPYLLNPSSLSKSDSELNPSMAREFVKQQGSGKKIEQGQAGITISYKPDNKKNFEATVFGVSRSMLNPIPGRVIKLNRVSGGLRTNFSTLFSISNMSFRILSGADFEFQNDVRTEFVNNGIINYKSLSNKEIINNVRIGETLLDQNEKVNGLGLFSKLEFSPYEKFNVSVGVRYDKYNFNVVDKFKTDGVDYSGSLPMSNISQSVGVTYLFNNSFHVYANYTTSFQTPTTSELSNSPDRNSGFNTTLKPELLNNFELGARGALYNNTLFYNAALYKLITDRILIPYQIPDLQTEEVFYRNSGSASNNGAELSLIWFPHNSLNVTASYTYMDFKYKDFISSARINNTIEIYQLEGKRVPGIPKQKLSVELTYKFLFGLNTAISFNALDRIYVNDWNGPTPNTTGNNSDYYNNGFFTTDLKFVYNLFTGFGNVGLFGGINNLFNVRYNSSVVPNAAANRYFEPGAPRNWYGGLSVKFF